jgi:VWFA-related protein
MFGKCRSACAAAALLLFVGVVIGQNRSADPQEVRIHYGIYVPPSATISVQSNLVELGVTIRDRKGQPVGGFTATDFEVLDDGKPQAITFFSEERAGAPPSKSSETQEGAKPASGAANESSGAPASNAHSARYVALFIDDTHSGLRALQTSKVAAEKFVATSLQPEDRMAVFTDSGDVTLDFTSKKEALLAAIERIKLQTRPGARGFTDCPALSSYQAYVIANHLDSRARKIAVEEAVDCFCPPRNDPEECKRTEEGFVDGLAQTVWDQTKSESTTALDVLKIVVQRLAKAPGEKVLVIVSPGFITGGMEQQTSGIVDAALRGHIVINSLDSEGLLSSGESPEERRVDEAVRAAILPEMMSAAAAATGGQFIRNNNDLTASLRALASVPEVSYRLGFAPVNRPDDKYHRLKVRLKNGGDYGIQSRDAYYSTVAGKEAESPQQRIDREVDAKEQLDQIPVVVRVSPGIAKDGQFPIRVVIQIDAKQLKFAKQGGRNLQQLTFVAVLEDFGGNYVAGKQAVMDLLLTDTTLAAFRAKGFGATLTFTAPKGSYVVREVVRELVQNHMAASNTPVDCR